MTHRESTTKTTRPPPRATRRRRELGVALRPRALGATRVTPAWVEELLGYEGMCVVDVRAPDQKGMAPHLPGYVPTAVTLDADSVLAASARARSGVIEFAHAMASHGVDSSHYVVVVDETGRERAERLVWALRRFGHASAAVMDGGYARWAAEGRRVKPAPRVPGPASFTARMVR